MKSLAALASLLMSFPVPARGPVDTVTVTFAPDTVTVRVGEYFTLDSRLTNQGTTPTERIYVHLNVASLDTAVYVDPEDWLYDRTQEVRGLAPGESVALSWDIQAVNSGTFDIYVVLLPNGPQSAGTGPLAVSPPVHARVADRQNLNPGGSLPVVLLVPLALVAAVAGNQYRLRRAA